MDDVKKQKLILEKAISALREGIITETLAADKSKDLSNTAKATSFCRTLKEKKKRENTIRDRYHWNIMTLVIFLFSYVEENEVFTQILFRTFFFFERSTNKQKVVKFLRSHSLQNFENFAEGPFRFFFCEFRICWDLSKFFHKFRGMIRLYLKQEAGIRKIRTNYETTMIFTFDKLAKAYVLYRIKTVYKFVLKKKFFVRI